MKKILFLFFALLITFSSAIAQSRSSSDVYVRGYTKRDGTVVPGHYRSAPNSTNRDNFSTRGNTNPYTGKKGWIDPDNNSYSTKSSDYSSSGYYSSSSYSSSSEYEKADQIIMDAFFDLNKKKSSPNNSSSNFAKPLESKGENYFYALEKRYIGLESEIIFGGNYIDGYHEDLSMNIGIQVDGGGLIRFFRKVEWGKRGRVVGKVIFFLANGESVICYDKKMREDINNELYSYYKLTRDEIHSLERSEIDLIQYTTTYPDNFHQLTQIVKRQQKPLAPSNCNSCSKTMIPISKLFSPYWEKRNN